MIPFAMVVINKFPESSKWLSVANCQSCPYYSILLPTGRSRGSLIEIEESAQPRATSHATRHVDKRRAGDEAIADTLVIPFGVVVRDVLRYSRSKMPFSEWNQPIQAFFFDRPYEPFGVGVCIGGALGREDHTDARFVESTPHVAAPLPVSIANEDVGRARILGHRQRPHDLLHEQRVGMRRGPEDLDAP
jgi:hypothetical protein